MAFLKISITLEENQQEQMVFLGTNKWQKQLEM
jgi:hypothetical protein